MGDILPFLSVRLKKGCYFIQLYKERERLS